MIRTIIVDDEILSRIGIQSFIDGKVTKRHQQKAA